MLYIHSGRALSQPTGPADLAVLIEADTILAMGRGAELPCPPGADRLDAAGRLIAPGFIDLQLNGAFGLDFTAAPESIWEVGRRLPRYGVTAFLPTIITSALTTVAAAQRVLQAGPPAGYAGAGPPRAGPGRGAVDR